jgi:curved DNA-binding protein CbpA
VRFQRNFYEVFGLSPTATRHEIRERYLELVRRYHPDRSSNKAPAERLLTQINIAFQTLRDPEKREAYDQILVRRDVAKQSNSAAPAASAKAEAPPKPTFDPTDALKVAHSAYLRGDRTEAQRCCEEIIKALPNEPQALQLLGDVFADQGRRVESLAAYHAALAEDPKSRLLQGKIQRVEDALAAAAARPTPKPAPAPAPASKRTSKPPEKRPLFQLGKRSR